MPANFNGTRAELQPSKNTKDINNRKNIRKRRAKRKRKTKEEQIMG